MFEYQLHDAFLSEEDLDLQHMNRDEVVAYWNVWLLQMQATNDEDKDDYSHGVFLSDKQKREIWGENWEEEIEKLRP